MKKLSILFILSLLAFVPVVNAQTSAHSIALGWNASTTPGVTYNVLRGTVSGGPYSQINTGAVTGLAFVDNILSGGVTYFYVVRAFDGFMESTNSNQASATAPSAPAPATGLVVTGVK